MLDAVVYLLENHLDIVEKEYEVTNLCQFFLHQIINKYNNTPIKNTICSFPVRMNVYGSLFHVTMKVLNKKFNLGGIENFETFDGMKIPLVEVVSLCVYVLNQAVDENKNLLIKNYFIHNF